jgi:hypothetical protein
MVLDDVLFKFARLVYLAWRFYVKKIREKDTSFSLILDENPTILFTERFYHNYREVVIGQQCQTTHKSGGRGGVVHIAMLIVDYLFL